MEVSGHLHILAASYVYDRYPVGHRAVLDTMVKSKIRAFDGNRTPLFQTVAISTELSRFIGGIVN
jgi:hypothetical protein